MSPILVILSRIGLLGLWFLTTLLMARFLGKAEFGVYVFCITLIKLFSTFIADTLDLAVLRRAPVYLKENRPRAIALVRTSFWLRIVVGFGVAVGLALLSPWLARRFLDSEQLMNLVLLAAAGIVGDLLLRGALVYFQSAAHFGRFMLLEGTVQLGRIALIGSLILLERLTARDALVIYVSLSYFVFVMALAIAPRDLYGPVPSARQELLDLLHFSKWMILASGIAALSERMELFLVGYFLSPVELGVYGAALILATIPEFIEGAVGTVLTPKVAQMRRQGRIPELQARYRKWSVPLCLVAFSGVLLFGDWFTTKFLSEKFILASAVFKVQMVGAMFWLAFAPVSAALVAFVSAKHLAAINLVGLLVRSAAGVVLIPILGAMGAGIIFLTMRIGMGLGVLIIGKRLLASGMNVEMDQPANVPVAEGIQTEPTGRKPEA